VVDIGILRFELAFGNVREGSNSTCYLMSEVVVSFISPRVEIDTTLYLLHVPFLHVNWFELLSFVRFFCFGRIRKYRTSEVSELVTVW
jgi:hypothetical protein